MKILLVIKNLNRQNQILISEFRMTQKMHFCTIINSDYIDYVKTQFHLLKGFNDNIILHVFINTTDITEIQTPQYRDLPDSIKCLTLLDLCKEGVGKNIYDKYYSIDITVLRWAMKPVVLSYILKNEVCDKVMWIDWDIMFFNDYKFLFDDLDHYDVLLTPHWFTMSPFETDSPNSEQDFKLNFERGLFNAGFIAVNKNFSQHLYWWAKACLQLCEINPQKGLWGDQIHLNLFPLLSERVGIVRHKGCNVAEWNKTECKRVKVGNETLINGEFPIIFIHFTNLTVSEILRGIDDLLLPYFDTYANKYKEVTGKPLPMLLSHNHQQERHNREASISVKVTKKIQYVQSKMRIRTRLRKFLEG